MLSQFWTRRQHFLGKESRAGRSGKDIVYYREHSLFFRRCLPSKTRSKLPWYFAQRRASIWLARRNWRLTSGPPCACSSTRLQATRRQRSGRTSAEPGGGGSVLRGRGCPHRRRRRGPATRDRSVQSGQATLGLEEGTFAESRGGPTHASLAGAWGRCHWDDPHKHECKYRKAMA